MASAPHPVSTALDILRKIVADGVGRGFLEEDSGRIDVMVSFREDERALIRELKMEALSGQSLARNLARRAIIASRAGEPFCVTPAEYDIIRRMEAGEWDAAVLSVREEMGLSVRDEMGVVWIDGGFEEPLAPVQVVVE